MVANHVLADSGAGGAGARTAITPAQGAPALRRLVLWAAVIGPLAAVVILVIGIVISLRNPPVKQPPVGAGAGDTGGANALGQMLGAAAAANQPGDAPPDALPQMVAPETLAQGFVLVVTDEPKLATLDSPMFLAGNLNNWNPGSGAFRLSPQSDLRWRYIFDGPPKLPAGARLEFKLTRGSWDLEELDENLAKIPNRTLPMIDASRLKPDEKPTVEITVKRWADQAPGFAKREALNPYRAIAASGTLRRIQVSSGVATARGAMRDVLVWLPPGYDDPRNADRRYPVLYLMDGQNVFEKLPTVPAEWEVDETATRLVRDGTVEPLIIVGVPHSGAGRIAEYLPVAALPGVTPEGDAFVSWLASEVVPRVNSAVRTDPRASRTAIGGSSLGAVIALHAATTRADLFGMVLAESLPLNTGGRAAWDAYIKGITQWPQRIYLGMGEAETGRDPANASRNAGYVQAVRDFDALLGSSGVDATRRLLVVEPNAEHTEAAWARRFPQALTFLFQAAPDSTK
jgi:predicted alpha/beta superfamily hydrolase